MQINEGFDNIAKTKSVILQTRDTN